MRLNSFKYATFPSTLKNEVVQSNEFGTTIQCAKFLVFSLYCISIKPKYGYGIIRALECFIRIWN